MTNMKDTFFNKGFSLAELMVVISIIGILSAILYANFHDAREDARNKSLQAEMKSMQLAVELFKSQNGKYPNPCGGGDSATSKGCAVYIEALVPDFIAELPSHKDSANTNCDIEYKVLGDRSWYKLTAINCHAGASSAAEGIQEDDILARCPGSCSNCGGSSYDPTAQSFYESYAVYSAGGQCE